MGLFSSGWQLARAQDSTATAADTENLYDRFLTTTAYKALDVKEGGALCVIPLASDAPNDFNRRRGAEIIFVGSGSADQTIAYKLWQIDATRSAGAQAPDGRSLMLIGVGTATLGTMVGQSGAIIGTNTLVADGVTFTPTGFGATLVASYWGGVSASDVVYNHSGNSYPGRLVIPDMGTSDIGLELYRGTASSANALVKVVL